MKTMVEVYKVIKDTVVKDGNCPFKVNDKHKDMKCSEFNIASCMQCKIFKEFYNNYKKEVKDV